MPRPVPRPVPRQTSWMALAAAGVLALAASARADLPAMPVEQWRWDGDVQDPTRNFPVGTPVVVQTNDDNGDGAIDEADTPDVAFLHWGFGFLDNAALTVLDGATGAETWTVTSPAFSVFGTNGSVLAAGDLDGDGLVEFAVSDGPDGVNLIVFENDGAFASTRPFPGARTGYSPSLGIADLNQDGVPEVNLRARVVSMDGSLSWAGSTTTAFASCSSFAQVADVRPDVPGLELFAGHALYSATGAVLWSQGAVPEGAAAIGDLDGDTVPEIALSARDTPTLWLLDPFGNLVIPPVDLIPPAQSETQPVLADLDGDTLPEILQPAGLSLQAWDWDAGTGTLVPMWQSPYADGSCCADATAYDFDGDGRAEVVFHDQSTWGVVSGCDGRLLFETGFVSATAMEGPVVANIDKDAAAEIVVSGLQGVGANLNAVVAYEIPGSTTPRAIWNQKTYHVTNVNDDGTIPVVEGTPWTSNRSWHAQDRTDSAPPVMPDLLDGATARDPFDCNLGILVEWSSPAAPPGTTFDVYRSEDQASPTCADALSRPPVATGLTGSPWFDGGTAVDAWHAYVVRATLDTSCQSASEDACTAAVQDISNRPPPDGAYAVLRASHVGEEVTFLWPTVRALLPDEHFHLLKALDSPVVPFVRTNPETDLSVSHTETDVSSWLQFFDLRIANECEIESAPEYR